MQVKLTELYHTKYFYLTYVKDLSYLFNSCVTLWNSPTVEIHSGSELMTQIFDCVRKHEQVVFDLAGAKFTADTRVLILRFMREGLEFIDSTDATRDSILKTDKERFSIVLEDVINLPMLYSTTSLKDYLSNLDNTKVYDTTQFTDQSLLLPLLAVIEIRRPTVRVNITSQLTAFMRFIAEMIPIEYLESCDDFYFTTINGTAEVTKCNGKIPTQAHGYVSIPQALTYGVLVPRVLGTQNLSKAPMWEDIFKTCIDMVNKNKKQTSLFLSDIL